MSADLFRKLSLLFSPPTSGLACLLFLFCYFNFSLADLGIATLFYVVGPIALVIYSTRKGEDIFVEERDKRPKYILAAMVSYAVGVALTRNNHALFWLGIHYVIQTVVLLVVTTLCTKTSVHMISTTGPQTFVLLYTRNPAAVLLYFFAFVAGVSRKALAAHTDAQLLLGVLQGIGLELLLFTLGLPEVRT